MFSVCISRFSIPSTETVVSATANPSMSSVAVVRSLHPITITTTPLSTTKPKDPKSPSSSSSLTSMILEIHRSTTLLEAVGANHVGGTGDNNEGGSVGSARPSLEKNPLEGSSSPLAIGGGDMSIDHDDDDEETDGEVGTPERADSPTIVTQPSSHSVPDCLHVDVGLGPNEIEFLSITEEAFQSHNNGTGSLNERLTIATVTWVSDDTAVVHCRTICGSFSYLKVVYLNGKNAPFPSSDQPLLRGVCECHGVCDIECANQRGVTVTIPAALLEDAIVRGMGCKKSLQDEIKLFRRRLAAKSAVVDSYATTRNSQSDDHAQPLEYSREVYERSNLSRVVQQEVDEGENVVLVGQRALAGIWMIAEDTSTRPHSTTADDDDDDTTTKLSSSSSPEASSPARRYQHDQTANLWLSIDGIVASIQLIPPSQHAVGQGDLCGRHVSYRIRYRVPINTNKVTQFLTDVDDYSITNKLPADALTLDFGRIPLPMWAVGGRYVFVHDDEFNELKVWALQASTAVICVANLPLKDYFIHPLCTIFPWLLSEGGAASVAASSPGQDDSGLCGLVGRGAPSGPSSITPQLLNWAPFVRVGQDGLVTTRTHNDMGALPPPPLVPLPTVHTLRCTEDGSTVFLFHRNVTLYGPTTPEVLVALNASTFISGETDVGGLVETAGATLKLLDTERILRGSAGAGHGSMLQQQQQQDRQRANRKLQQSTAARLLMMINDVSSTTHSSPARRLAGVLGKRGSKSTKDGTTAAASLYASLSSSHSATRAALFSGVVDYTSIFSNDELEAESAVKLPWGSIERASKAKVDLFTKKFFLSGADVLGECIPVDIASTDSPRDALIDTSSHNKKVVIDDPKSNANSIHDATASPHNFSGHPDTQIDFEILHVALVDNTLVILLSTGRVIKIGHAGDLNAFNNIFNISTGGHSSDDGAYTGVLLRARRPPLPPFVTAITMDGVHGTVAHFATPSPHALSNDGSSPTTSMSNAAHLTKDSLLTNEINHGGASRAVRLCELNHWNVSEIQEKTLQLAVSESADAVFHVVCMAFKAECMKHLSTAAQSTFATTEARYLKQRARSGYGGSDLSGGGAVMPTPEASATIEFIVKCFIAKDTCSVDATASSQSPAPHSPTSSVRGRASVLTTASAPAPTKPPSRPANTLQLLTRLTAMLCVRFDNCPDEPAARRNLISLLKMCTVMLGLVSEYCAHISEEMENTTITADNKMDRDDTRVEDDEDPALPLRNTYLHDLVLQSAPIPLPFNIPSPENIPDEIRKSIPTTHYNYALAAHDAYYLLSLRQGVLSLQQKVKESKAVSGFLSESANWSSQASGLACLVENQESGMMGGTLSSGVGGGMMSDASFGVSNEKLVEVVGLPRRAIQDIIELPDAVMNSKTSFLVSGGTPSTTSNSIAHPQPIREMLEKSQHKRTNNRKGSFMGNTSDAPYTPAILDSSKKDWNTFVELLLGVLSSSSSPPLQSGANDTPTVSLSRQAPANAALVLVNLLIPSLHKDVLLMLDYHCFPPQPVFTPGGGGSKAGRGRSSTTGGSGDEFGSSLLIRPAPQYFRLCTGMSIPGEPVELAAERNQDRYPLYLRHLQHLVGVVVHQKLSLLAHMNGGYQLKERQSPNFMYVKSECDRLWNVLVNIFGENFAVKWCNTASSQTANVTLRAMINTVCANSSSGTTTTTDSENLRSAITQLDNTIADTLLSQRASSTSTSALSSSFVDLFYDQCVWCSAQEKASTDATMGILKELSASSGNIGPALSATAPSSSASSHQRRVRPSIRSPTDDTSSFGGGAGTARSSTIKLIVSSEVVVDAVKGALEVHLADNTDVQRTILQWVMQSQQGNRIDSETFVSLLVPDRTFTRTAAPSFSRGLSNPFYYDESDDDDDTRGGGGNQRPSDANRTDGKQQQLRNSQHAVPSRGAAVAAELGLLERYLCQGLTLPLSTNGMRSSISTSMGHRSKQEQQLQRLYVADGEDPTTLVQRMMWVSMLMSARRLVKEYSELQSLVTTERSSLRTTRMVERAIDAVVQGAEEDEDLDKALLDEDDNSNDNFNGDDDTVATNPSPSPQRPPGLIYAGTSEGTSSRHPARLSSVLTMNQLIKKLKATLPFTEEELMCPMLSWTGGTQDAVGYDTIFQIDGSGASSEKSSNTSLPTDAYTFRRLMQNMNTTSGGTATRFTTDFPTKVKGDSDDVDVRLAFIRWSRVFMERLVYLDTLVRTHAAAQQNPRQILLGLLQQLDSASQSWLLVGCVEYTVKYGSWTTLDWVAQIVANKTVEVPTSDTHHIPAITTLATTVGFLLVSNHNEQNVKYNLLHQDGGRILSSGESSLEKVIRSAEVWDTVSHLNSRLSCGDRQMPTVVVGGGESLTFGCGEDEDESDMAPSSDLVVLSHLYQTSLSLVVGKLLSAFTQQQDVESFITNTLESITKLLNATSTTTSTATCIITAAIALSSFIREILRHPIAASALHRLLSHLAIIPSSEDSTVDMGSLLLRRVVLLECTPAFLFQIVVSSTSSSSCDALLSSFATFSVESGFCAIMDRLGSQGEGSHYVESAEMLIGNLTQQQLVRSQSSALLWAAKCHADFASSTSSKSDLETKKLHIQRVVGDAFNRLLSLSEADASGLWGNVAVAISSFTELIADVSGQNKYQVTLGDSIRKAVSSPSSTSDSISVLSEVLAFTALVALDDASPLTIVTTTMSTLHRLIATFTDQAGCNAATAAQHILLLAPAVAHTIEDTDGSNTLSTSPAQNTVSLWAATLHKISGALLRVIDSDSTPSSDMMQLTLYIRNLLALCCSIEEKNGQALSSPESSVSQLVSLSLYNTFDTCLKAFTRVASTTALDGQRQSLILAASQLASDGMTATAASAPLSHTERYFNLSAAATISNNTTTSVTTSQSAIVESDVEKFLGISSDAGPLDYASQIVLMDAMSTWDAAASIVSTTTESSAATQATDKRDAIEWDVSVLDLIIDGRPFSAHQLFAFQLESEIEVSVRSRNSSDAPEALRERAASFMLTRTRTYFLPRAHHIGHMASAFSFIRLLRYGLNNGRCNAESMRFLIDAQVICILGSVIHRQKELQLSGPLTDLEEVSTALRRLPLVQLPTTTSETEQKPSGVSNTNVNQQQSSRDIQVISRSLRELHTYFWLSCAAEVAGVPAPEGTTPTPTPQLLSAMFHNEAANYDDASIYNNNGISLEDSTTTLFRSNILEAFSMWLNVTSESAHQEENSAATIPRSPEVATSLGQTLVRFTTCYSKISTATSVPSSEIFKDSDAGWYVKSLWQRAHVGDVQPDDNTSTTTNPKWIDALLQAWSMGMESETLTSLYWDCSSQLRFSAERWQLPIVQSIASCHCSGANTSSKFPLYISNDRRVAENYTYHSQQIGTVLQALLSKFSRTSGADDLASNTISRSVMDVFACLDNTIKTPAQSSCSLSNVIQQLADSLMDASSSDNGKYLSPSQASVVLSKLGELSSACNNLFSECGSSSDFCELHAALHAFDALCQLRCINDIKPSSSSSSNLSRALLVFGCMYHPSLPKGLHGALLDKSTAFEDSLSTLGPAPNSNALGPILLHAARLASHMGLLAKIKASTETASVLLLKLVQDALDIIDSGTTSKPLMSTALSVVSSSTIVFDIMLMQQNLTTFEKDHLQHAFELVDDFYTTVKSVADEQAHILSPVSSHSHHSPPRTPSDKKVRELPSNASLPEPPAHVTNVARKQDVVIQQLVDSCFLQTDTSSLDTETSSSRVAYLLQGISYKSSLETVEHLLNTSSSATSGPHVTSFSSAKKYFTPFVEEVGYLPPNDITTIAHYLPQLAKISESVRHGVAPANCFSAFSSLDERPSVLTMVSDDLMESVGRYEGEAKRDVVRVLCREAFFRIALQREIHSITEGIDRCTQNRITDPLLFASLCQTLSDDDGVAESLQSEDVFTERAWSWLSPNVLEWCVDSLIFAAKSGELDAAGETVSLDQDIQGLTLLKGVLVSAAEEEERLVEDTVADGGIDPILPGGLTLTITRTIMAVMYLMYFRHDAVRTLYEMRSKVHVVSSLLEDGSAPAADGVLHFQTESVRDAALQLGIEKRRATDPPQSETAVTVASPVAAMNPSAPPKTSPALLLDTATDRNEEDDGGEDAYVASSQQHKPRKELPLTTPLPDDDEGAQSGDDDGDGEDKQIKKKKKKIVVVRRVKKSELNGEDIVEPIPTSAAMMSAVPTMTATQRALAQLERAGGVGGSVTATPPATSNANDDEQQQDGVKKKRVIKIIRKVVKKKKDKSSLEDTVSKAADGEDDGGRGGDRDSIESNSFAPSKNTSFASPPLLPQALPVSADKPDAISLVVESPPTAFEAAFPQNKLVVYVMPSPFTVSSMINHTIVAVSDLLLAHAIGPAIVFLLSNATGKGKVFPRGSRTLCQQIVAEWFALSPSRSLEFNSLLQYLLRKQASSEKSAAAGSAASPTSPGGASSFAGKSAAAVAVTVSQALLHNSERQWSQQQRKALIKARRAIREEAEAAKSKMLVAMKDAEAAQVKAGNVSFDHHAFSSFMESVKKPSKSTEDPDPDTQRKNNKSIEPSVHECLEEELLGTGEYYDDWCSSDISSEDEGSTELQATAGHDPTSNSSMQGGGSSKRRVSVWERRLHRPHHSHYPTMVVSARAYLRDVKLPALFREEDAMELWNTNIRLLMDLMRKIRVAERKQQEERDSSRYGDDFGDGSVGGVTSPTGTTSGDEKISAERQMYLQLVRSTLATVLTFPRPRLLDVLPDIIRFVDLNTNAALRHCRISIPNPDYLHSSVADANAATADTIVAVAEQTIVSEVPLLAAECLLPPVAAADNDEEDNDDQNSVPRREKSNIALCGSFKNTSLASLSKKVHAPNSTMKTRLDGIREYVFTLCVEALINSHFVPLIWDCTDRVFAREGRKYENVPKKMEEWLETFFYEDSEIFKATGGSPDIGGLGESSGWSAVTRVDAICSLLRELWRDPLTESSITSSHRSDTNMHRTASGALGQHQDAPSATIVVSTDFASTPVTTRLALAIVSRIRSFQRSVKLPEQRFYSRVFLEPTALGVTFMNWALQHTHDDLLARHLSTDFEKVVNFALYDGDFELMRRMVFSMGDISVLKYICDTVPPVHFAALANSSPEFQRMPLHNSSMRLGIIAFFERLSSLATSPSPDTGNVDLVAKSATGDTEMTTVYANFYHFSALGETLEQEGVDLMSAFVNSRGGGAIVYGSDASSGNSKGDSQSSTRSGGFAALTKRASMLVGGGGGSQKAGSGGGRHDDGFYISAAQQAEYDKLPSSVQKDAEILRRQNRLLDEIEGRLLSAANFFVQDAMYERCNKCVQRVQLIRVQHRYLYRDVKVLGWDASLSTHLFDSSSPNPIHHNHHHEETASAVSGRKSTVPNNKNSTLRHSTRGGSVDGDSDTTSERGGADLNRAESFLGSLRGHRAGDLKKASTMQLSSTSHFSSPHEAILHILTSGAGEHANVSAHISQYAHPTTGALLVPIPALTDPTDITKIASSYQVNQMEDWASILYTHTVLHGHRALFNHFINHTFPGVVGGGSVLPSANSNSAGLSSTARTQLAATESLRKSRTVLGEVRTLLSSEILGNGAASQITSRKNNFNWMVEHSLEAFTTLAFY